jgi:type IV pilus assembly protein PilO
MKIPEVFNKLDTLSTAKKILILALTVILLAGGYWYFHFQPAYTNIQGLEKDITQLEQTIARFRAKVAKLPELKQKLASRQQELVYARTLLPDSTHAVENLLSQIEKLGKDVGVDFVLFSPGREKVHDFYATRSVNLRLQGPFHHLMRFFSRISRLQRLVTLESLNLQPASAKKNDTIILSANSRISIYRALTEKELEARKKKKKS